MNKILLLFLSIIFLGHTFVHAQKNKDKVLHFGIKPFFGVPNISFGDVKGFELYFANEKNETLKWDYEWDGKSDSKFPLYPNLYMQLDYGNHLFFRADAYLLWFTNKVKYRNSVDAGEFFGAYSDEDNEVEYGDFGYNEIKIQWLFAGNSIMAGYSFLKTKSFQPYLLGGISVMYLMQFKPIDVIEQRQNRIDILMANIDTYKKVTIYPSIGAGVKYRGMSLEILYQFSEDVDTNKPIYIKDENEYIENFTGFNMLSIALKVNLISRNLNKSKLK